MGQIILSGDELVRILAANAQMPEQVTGIETEGEENVRASIAWLRQQIG